MALSADTVWEVRSTGAATNGGGFVVGASGTDHSQQDAAQYSVTDAVTDGSTTITSATANFGADVVGNILYVQGGTGAIAAGWYQITVRNSATSITVDRATGLTTGTGATLKIGGALSSLTVLAPIMVGSNKAFIKASGGYTQTATVQFAASVVVSNSGMYSRLIGYTTTRGDGGQATITLSTNTDLIGMELTGNGWSVENMAINCATLGTSTGIKFTSVYYKRLLRCKVSNATLLGIYVQGVHQDGHIQNCEVTGCTAAATAAINIEATNVYTVRNWIHDNACTGITTNVSHTIMWNLVTNNTGASSDGIQLTGQNVHQVMQNTVYASGRHGINSTLANNLIGFLVKNNVLVSNGGYGVQMSAEGNPAMFEYDGNAYFNNTSGTRNNMDNTTGVNSVAPYTNVLDVILTATPFTNAAGNVFTLNTTAGGGAACRAAGSPGALPGGLTTGYLDIGAAQHQDTPSTASAGITAQLV